MITNKPKVIKAFISYASEDKDYADLLINNIKIHTKRPKEFIWNIWCDKEIPIGKKWHETIQEEVRASDCAILLISPNFFASEILTVRK